jgi:hypothetical protein
MKIALEKDYNVAYNAMFASSYIDARKHTLE